MNAPLPAALNLGAGMLIRCTRGHNAYGSQDCPQCSDETVSRDPTPEFLGRRFGLTPAEAEIAAQIATGVHRRNIARIRDRSQATVDSQMRTVFEKMGVRTQVALAATAWRAWCASQQISRFSTSKE